jgi:hypothetical protein
VYALPPAPPSAPLLLEPAKLLLETVPLRPRLTGSLLGDESEEVLGCRPCPGSLVANCILGEEFGGETDEEEEEGGKGGRVCSGGGVADASTCCSGSSGVVEVERRKREEREETVRGEDAQEA